MDWESENSFEDQAPKAKQGGKDSGAAIRFNTRLSNPDYVKAAHQGGSLKTSAAPTTRIQTMVIGLYTFQPNRMIWS